MGLIERVFGLVFGGNRNVLRDTVEVFRENAEGAGVRASAMQDAALGQYETEFERPVGGGFDRFMDGVNRLPRPLLAFGTIGLFIAAIHDPIWFSQRMQGIALVPEPLWWLLGAIVSFYFGARQQKQGQEFQRQMVRTLARAPQVVRNLRSLQNLRATSPGVAKTGTNASLVLEAVAPAQNDALADWHRQREADRR